MRSSTPSKDGCRGAEPVSVRKVGRAEGSTPEADQHAEAVPSVPPTDDLIEAVAKVQADLTQAGMTGPMRRDPYRLLLGVQSAMLGVHLKNVHRWERAVADVIAARDPLPPEQRAALAASLVEATEQGAFQAMRKEAARMVRTLDRALMLRVALGVGGAYVAGALSVLAVFAFFLLGPFDPATQAANAWRALIAHNPDPSPSLAAAEVRREPKTGRRYYAGVSLWLDPQLQAPTTSVKPKEAGQ